MCRVYCSGRPIHTIRGSFGRLYMRTCTGRLKMSAPGIGNTKPLFTRVFSTDRVRTPVPPCRLVPAPGVGPHAQRRTLWRAHRQGVQGVPEAPRATGSYPSALPALGSAGMPGAG
jgi:hypothetical protein